MTKNKKVPMVWATCLEGDFASSEVFLTEAEAMQAAEELARAEVTENPKNPRPVYLMRSIAVLFSPPLPKIKIPPVRVINFV